MSLINLKSILLFQNLPDILFVFNTLERGDGNINFALALMKSFCRIRDVSQGTKWVEADESEAGATVWKKLRIL